MRRVMEVPLPRLFSKYGEMPQIRSGLVCGVDHARNKYARAYKWRSRSRLPRATIGRPLKAFNLLLRRQSELLFDGLGRLANKS